ncbi:hypothetical protein L1987_54048 [Smallanthus sonchifolius]|uniref:Uncharacterized protein n=1 Tax=Smallanthus sonchifolius TaxID=185202 RepID=A0ACB9E5M1_9ASTR|nr:hypothetical protein L1987_54048 [Smallanthus sonchifolius]
MTGVRVGSTNSNRLESQATQASHPHRRDKEVCMGKEGEKLIGSDSNGGVIHHPPVPYLNNSTGESSSVGIVDSRGYDHVPQTIPNDGGEASLRDEIEATCEMGNLLGGEPNWQGRLGQIGNSR